MMVKGFVENNLLCINHVYDDDDDDDDDQHHLSDDDRSGTRCHHWVTWLWSCLYNQWKLGLGVEIYASYSFIITKSDWSEAKPNMFQSSVSIWLVKCPSGRPCGVNTFKTPTLHDCSDNVDETCHAYSMGLGTKLLEVQFWISAPALRGATPNLAQLWEMAYLKRGAFILLTS